MLTIKQIEGVDTLENIKGLDGVVSEANRLQDRVLIFVRFVEVTLRFALIMIMLEVLSGDGSVIVAIGF